ncbi:MAG: helix-turn-helix transcriptional regulator [Kiritimatiellae bacterium]|nr:helix-turn-helix transcriptional regulator [Kiritimatiellia bacterium]
MDNVREFLKWPVETVPGWAAVWPTAVGYHDCRLNRNLTGPDFYCPHLMARGRVRFEYGAGTAAVLGAGEMFACFPGMPFGFEQQTGDVLCYWVRVAGHLVREFVCGMGFSVERPYLRAKDPRTVERCFEGLLALATHYDAGADMEAAAALHRMAGAAGYVPGPPPEHRSLAGRVRAFMEQELDRGLNIDQISRAFGVSRSTLFLHVKREYRRSPIQVLAELRMARARALLVETALPVSEVARMCGYADPLHFSREFARRQGAAPTAFRRGSAARDKGRKGTRKAEESLARP